MLVFLLTLLAVSRPLVSAKDDRIITHPTHVPVPLDAKEEAASSSNSESVEVPPAESSSSTEAADPPKEPPQEDPAQDPPSGIEPTPAPTSEINVSELTEEVLKRFDQIWGLLQGLDNGTLTIVAIVIVCVIVVVLLGLFVYCVVVKLRRGENLCNDVSIVIGTLMKNKHAEVPADQEDDLGDIEISELNDGPAAVSTDQGTGAGTTVVSDTASGKKGKGKNKKKKGAADDGFDISAI